MKYLIVGLGNIGKEYEHTRHNIGFMIVDKLVTEFGDSKFEMDRLAFKSELKYKGKMLHIIKPTTYMNLSGKSVNYWLNDLKIPIENLLVLTDDLSISFGTIRLKSKGSAGGHNGLKNIEFSLQSQNYARLRFGVGDNFSKGKQVDFVLSDFSKDEQIELPILIDKSLQTIFDFIVLGIDKAMNNSNTKK